MTLGLHPVTANAFPQPCIHLALFLLAPPSHLLSGSVWVMEGEGLAPCGSAISFHRVRISPALTVTETECQSRTHKLSQKSILTHSINIGSASRSPGCWPGTITCD